MIVKVTDIKQYVYCPRIIYFTYVCPVRKKTSFKMDSGKEGHFSLDKLEKRRTLKRYRLHEGQRIFHTHLYSDRLGLEGKLDMHIVAGKNIVPVEYKFTERKASLNHKYQLISYALLLEDHYRTITRQGLLYLVPNEEITTVEITPDVRNFVAQIIDKIRTIVATERMPDRQRLVAKCRDCEYLRFCGDIDIVKKEHRVNVFFNE